MNRNTWKYSIALLFLLIGLKSIGQSKEFVFNNIKKGDTLRIDSLSILPDFLYLTINGDTVKNQINVIEGTGDAIAVSDIESGKIYYRTLNFNLSEPFQRKDSSLIQNDNVLTNQPTYTLQNRDQREPVFFEGLNKSGSLSRGITVGNNQDAVLSSNLNLQLSGNINPTTTVRASITDNQIPVYAEGISQSLQEFDRVFIEVENETFGKVQAGDFDIGPSGNYFLRFQKRISGAGIQSPIKLSNGILKVTGVGALARGEFNRNTFRGLEGNQGPYKLTGKNNELLILVISGSDRVYIDGKQLTRGLENDYVIDYTTGELTFTSLRPITKDHRIVVEFQYTVQNYVRSIGYGGVDYTSENWNHALYVYSEQDAKSQPIFSLSTEEQRTLSEAGDDPLKAISPTWNQQEYDANKILYRLTDTLGTDSVFVYSTNPNDTLYQVLFSFVGANQGNYIPINSSANGQIYQFVEPIAGVPQGSHIPYSILPRPELIQVVTYAGGWTGDNKNDQLKWEVAYSQNDPNRFSDIDDENHKGIASKLGYSKKWKSNQWNYQTQFSGEYQQEEFKTVERIRNVEFSRDWNISPQVNSDLWLANAEIRANKGNSFNLQFRSSFVEINDYFNGLKNDGRLLIKENGWWITFNGSYLISEDTSKTTRFFRQKSKIQKNFESLFYLGTSTSSESNSATPLTIANDLSYRFFHLNSYVGYGDTSKSYLEAGYFRNSDDTVRSEIWTPAALANGVYLKSSLRDSKKGTLLFRLQSRSLQTFSDQDSELRSITTRLQYNNRFFKNFLGWNSFYESGMGQEPARDFRYIKVPKGTGTHIWIDYNNNGLEELDEFEPAPFQDLGEYIRVFIISRNYTPVSRVKFSQQIDLNLNQLKGVRGTNKFIGKFNIQSYFLLDRKELLTDNINNLNPFDYGLGDSLILQSLQTFRNTFFFNRMNPIYGADYTYQQNTSKNLLSFGLENQLIERHTLNVRYLLAKKFDIRVTGTHSDKSNFVPDFENRNYQISSNSIKPIIAYQSGKYLRLSIDYSIEESVNLGENAESLNAHKTGAEFNFNHPKYVNSQVRLDWVNNDFKGEEFSPIGQELLKGLKPGNNILWRFSLQKNFTSFLQVILNYEGRTSADNPTVHTGSVQVKAFF